MAYFPFMIDIKEKPVLIAGAGKVAYRKVLSMLDFEADVTVVSPEFCEELLELYENLTTSDADSGKVRLTLIKRKVLPSDIEKAFVVIMATDDSSVNHEMAKLCRQKNILVNVVDVKDDCGFYFPAIIKDSDVTISVSTGGQSPLLAREIKRDIASSLDKSYGDIAFKLGTVREEIKAKYKSEEERKTAFEKLFKELLEDD